ncbi:hypothetical protein L484_000236 [Morus notabilis]|uniref:Uncharacterized protein n=1 Tax=Morus notabilis TaxID=981085 RepID=W9R3V2_9ROSA|nr:hypothetical protein L484_000236 [Morus notabilis]
MEPKKRTKKTAIKSNYCVRRIISLTDEDSTVVNTDCSSKSSSGIRDSITLIPRSRVDVMQHMTQTENRHMLHMSEIESQSMQHMPKIESRSSERVHASAIENNTENR